MSVRSLQTQYTQAYRRIDEVTKQRLASISTATVATILHRRGLRNQFVQEVFRLTTTHERPMIGQAFTIRHIPAREDIDEPTIFRDPQHPQRVAIETVPAGDVLVMDCRQDATAASLGGILATRLEMRGCAGVVTDAGIRDTAYSAALDLPIYVASRSAPTNLTKHHACDINVPIGCGGVPVYPGDMILGDADGVMVIPLHLVEAVIEDAVKMEHYEAFATLLMREGRSVIGIYPADEATLAEYETYCRTNPLTSRAH